MDALRDVKSWMSFYGWTCDGGPGAVKLDTELKTIGRHGDALWIEDVDKAIDALDRERAKEAMAELERRLAV